MSEWATIVTAFSLGLLSSAHCVGMCGGIMGALTMAIPASAKHRRWQLLLSYNLGRITSYTLMGLLLGFFAGGFSALGGAVWLRILAGALLIAMGLYLANWWRGLVYLERVGKYFWAYLQPLGRGLMPVSSVSKAFALGMLWGWLPCGLVYSALAYAMVQAEPLAAGTVMLAFGVGTLPAVLATGFAAYHISALLSGILRRTWVRASFAFAIILFGIWTIFAAMYHSAHEHGHDPVHNDPAPALDHSHH